MEQLWRDTLGLDNAFIHLGVADVAAVLDGTRGCTAHEYDVLAQALNDHFVDHGHNHPVRHADELGRGDLNGQHRDLTAP